MRQPSLLNAECGVRKYRSLYDLAAQWRHFNGPRVMKSIRSI